MTVCEFSCTTGSAQGTANYHSLQLFIALKTFITEEFCRDMSNKSRINLKMLLHALLLLTIRNSPPAAAAAVYHKEKEVLLRWKSSLYNDQYTRCALLSWNASIHPCSWAGVICDPSSTTVTALSLTNLLIEGTLHSLDCSSLPNLDTVTLGNNSLNGNIPSSISSLSKLTVLDLKQNWLSSNIPPFLGLMNSLQVLNLAGNDFSGFIPGSIGNLSNLKHLYLQGNMISGTIPVEIGNLKSLQELFLDMNYITGPIPSTIGNMGSLTILWLIMNKISRSIPSEIGRLSSLIQLVASNNYLSGSIPDTIGNLTSLKILNFLSYPKNVWGGGQWLRATWPPNPFPFFPPTHIRKTFSKNPRTHSNLCTLPSDHRSTSTLTRKTSASSSSTRWGSLLTEPTSKLTGIAPEPRVFTGSTPLGAPIAKRRPNLGLARRNELERYIPNLERSSPATTMLTSVLLLADVSMTSSPSTNRRRPLTGVDRPVTSDDVSLVDMLRACVMDMGGSWEDHVPLGQFSYDNSFH